jgi:hypothetical protein
VRNLFFALLFLNLALLAWWHWGGQSSRAAAAVPAAPSVPTLELAKIIAPSPGPATPATPTRCRSLGPFADSAAATAASDLMRARGWQPRDRSVDTSAPDGYWVYVGQLTAAAQKTVLARLNAAGIHDAASMTQPEQSDRVSVGYFADQTHAVRRAEQVRALGLKPVLDIHERTVPVHWLDVDLKSSDADLQPKVFQTGNSLQVTDCPAKAAGG